MLGRALMLVVDSALGGEENCRGLLLRGLRADDLRLDLICSADRVTKH